MLKYPRRPENCPSAYRRINFGTTVHSQLVAISRRKWSGTAKSNRI